jgi:excisionase family DNA binding protein
MSLPPILMPIPNAAQYIGRSVTFIYNALADGKIRAVKSDKRCLVEVASLHEYVATLPPATIKPDQRELRRRAARAAV